MVRRKIKDEVEARRCLLEATLDLFTRRVVGWALRSSLTRDLAIAALEQLLSRHDTLHSRPRTETRLRIVELTAP